jgi:hypothetical protein
MHWTGIITYCIVIPWLLAGAFVHETAAVLLAQWTMAEVNWIMTGDQMPLPLYIATDLTAALLVWQWKTGKDWAVLAFFVPMWLSYRYLGGAAQWWTLLGLFWAQAIIAGPWVLINRIGRRILPSRRLAQRIQAGLVKMPGKGRRRWSGV